MTPPTITVVAAVVEERGLFLLTRRQPGTHLEGCWEFPGGKRHEGETLEEALARELVEELAVRPLDPRHVFETAHEYPDRSVRLHFFRCRLAGTPRAVLGQEIRWVRREDLAALPFPPADAEFVATLARRT
jgi:8-oxo-dGTP diphosphatase